MPDGSLVAMVPRELVDLVRCSRRRPVLPALLLIVLLAAGWLLEPPRSEPWGLSIKPGSRPRRPAQMPATSSPNTECAAKSLADR
jgi:hypothetical protein